MARSDNSAVNQATARALKAMREKQGLSKSEVARRVGTSYAHVDKWESATATPGTANLAKLADAYEVDVPVVFNEVALAIQKAKRKIREEE